MKSSRLTLGLETALGKGSIALLTKDKIVDALEFQEYPLRSENILLNISEFLKRSDLRLSDIDYIAASSGPGSFTGIRLGLSIAYGLSTGIGCKVFEVSYLDALAAIFSETEKSMVITSGSDSKFFWGYYEKISNDLISYDKASGHFGKSENLPFDFSNRDIVLITDKNTIDRLANQLGEDFLKGVKLKIASDNAAVLISQYLNESLLTSNQIPDQGKKNREYLT